SLSKIRKSNLKKQPVDVTSPILLQSTDTSQVSLQVIVNVPEMHVILLGGTGYKIRNNKKNNDKNSDNKNDSKNNQKNDQNKENKSQQQKDQQANNSMKKSEADKWLNMVEDKGKEVMRGQILKKSGQNYQSTKDW
ncbi:MAG: hypothetical protein ACK4IX_17315, partial [Candidatus Sericytochromatia bacterium]